MSADKPAQLVKPEASQAQRSVTGTKRRGPGKPWKPGQSGNPSGRDAVLRARLERMMDLTKPAIEVLARGLTSENEEHAYKCAKEILDRALGKPKQQLEVNAQVVDMTALHLEALRALAQRPPQATPQPVTIDAQAIENKAHGTFE